MITFFSVDMRKAVRLVQEKGAFKIFHRNFLGHFHEKRLVLVVPTWPTLLETSKIPYGNFEGGMHGFRR